MHSRTRSILLSAFLILVFSLSAHARDGFVLALDSLDKDQEETTLRLLDKAVLLGTKHVTLPILLCQDGPTETQVYWCHQPKPAPAKTAAPDPAFVAQLKYITQAIKTRGLTLTYFPFLLSTDGAWRGYFEPTNFIAWGISYHDHLVAIADVAKITAPEEFVVGTELVKLFKKTQYWRNVMNQFREKLSANGTKVFAVANWDQWNDLDFWDASDYIALSAYFPLTQSESAPSDVQTLSASWLSWAKKLKQVSEKWNKPLYFAEVGYSSMQTAANEPWRFHPPTPVDLALQARLFEAFGKVWSGVYPGSEGLGNTLVRFQVWALTESSTPEQDAGFSIFGKPAEKALQDAFELRITR